MHGVVRLHHDLGVLLVVASLASSLFSCAKAKPAEDPLKSIKLGCDGAPYAPPADAKDTIEIVVANRLAKGSFGPMHVCVLLDDKPLLSVSDASRDVATATAIHVVAAVKDGKHTLRLLVEAAGVAEWQGFTFETSTAHDVDAHGALTATVTVFSKNAEKPKDMVAFEWKDTAPPPAPAVTGQVLNGPDGQVHP
ncbi:hypothetical protein BH09MYX1_BH09MYX1_12020 [soil metagenome]